MLYFSIFLICSWLTSWIESQIWRADCIYISKNSFSFKEVVECVILLYRLMTKFEMQATNSAFSNDNFSLVLFFFKQTQWQTKVYFNTFFSCLQQSGSIFLNIHVCLSLNACWLPDASGFIGICWYSHKHDRIKYYLPKDWWSEE